MQDIYQHRTSNTMKNIVKTMVYIHGVTPAVLEWVQC